MGLPESKRQMLMKLLNKKGHLSPSEFVEIATPKSSPYHDMFEWDDKKAGHAHRLQQARQILMSIKYMPLPASKPIRATISLSTERGYRSTAQVLSDSELRKVMVQDALAELISFKMKYKALHEFAKIFEEIDNVQNSIEVNNGKKQRKN